MQYLQTHLIFQKIFEINYNEIKKNYLINNLLGLFINFLLIFGFVNISIIFSFLTFGLLLYSIRVMMVYNIEKIDNVGSIVNINYLWISLIGLHISYNLLWGLFNIFGGFLMTSIVNLIYIILITNLINDLYKWCDHKNSLKKFDSKDFVINNDDNLSETLINQINFIGKLYNINRNLCDEIILPHGVNITNYIFNIIKTSSIFAKEFGQKSCNNLYNFSKNMKS